MVRKAVTFPELCGLCERHVVYLRLTLLNVEHFGREVLPVLGFDAGGGETPTISIINSVLAAS